jgi:SAM-dependent methyltransferase
VLELSFPLYQSHDDTPAGMSDSKRKLARLAIPLSFNGMTVLDIGCNEGYFCNLAIQRGAKKVVGIDFDKPRLDYARQKYPDQRIEFIYQRWNVLPKGPFDVVLWTSAMHYELDPRSVFENVASELAPNGLFIVECGAIDADTKEMRIVQRHSDTLFYPTMALLRSNLSDLFDVREVGFPEAPIGDPVPRYVFHCVPRSVAIVVIGGAASARNWRLVDSFRRAGAKEISLPKFVWSIATAQFHHTALQQTIRDEFPKRSFEDLLAFLEGRDMLNELFDWLLKAINLNDSVVILETGVDAGITTKIRTRADKKFSIWDLTKLA